MKVSLSARSLAPALRLLRWLLLDFRPISYLGYLPRKSSDRRTLLKEICALPYTLIFLESPYRIKLSLADLLLILGDRPVAVARELTKLFEEIFRGSLSEAISRFENEPACGEITLVVAGNRWKIEWSAEEVQIALDASWTRRFSISSSGSNRRSIRLASPRKSTSYLLKSFQGLTMFLDDLHSIERLDPQHMLAQINSLPDQLLEAWETSGSYELPAWSLGIEQVLVAGMGGSAIGADLLTSYVAPICTIPVSILRDYPLPAWANGPQTLVIGSSHSGNTEETLQAFREALERGCSMPGDHHRRNA